MGTLTLDSAGLVEKGTSATAIATFTAEQVTLQNSLGGTVSQSNGPTAGTLVIKAVDVLGVDPTGTTTGYNNAQISLGIGAVTLAGFSALAGVSPVTLKSSGQILVTGDGGSLTVESQLTLDAPRIGGGAMSMVNGLPQFGAAAYTITAVDNPANPSIYYAVNLTNSSSDPAPTLPAALFGNSLTTKAGDISINTAVALPGGAFNATANKGGNISVGSRGIVDVSGQAMTFVDVLATIGGGNINLTSTGGAISIVSGAVLNVGDLADVGAPNQNAAGTLTLAAPIGGVAIAAGALHGEGVDAASSGSFVLDTNSLSTSAPQNYDATSPQSSSSKSSVMAAEMGLAVKANSHQISNARTAVSRATIESKTRKIASKYWVPEISRSRRHGDWPMKDESWTNAEHMRSCVNNA